MPEPSPHTIENLSQKLVPYLTQTRPSQNIIEKTQKAHNKIREQLNKRIVGMSDVIEQLMIALFSGNHALLVGVPGLAKTLLIKSLGQMLDMKFARIQFTPDLMPSDITGTEILAYNETTNTREFAFLPGPLFTNLVLADEINRTPPKTQSAMLEAMEEKTITAMGKKFTINPPFLVLATQNPIEQEGTYPLPVAQWDRFLLNILVDYPKFQEEHDIMRMSLSLEPAHIDVVLQRDEFLEIIHAVRHVFISSALMDYAVQFCRCTRPEYQDTPDFIKQYVAWGASPRAAQNWIIASKTRSLLYGREEVLLEDLVNTSYPVLRHRILLHYRAEAEGFSQDHIISRLLEALPTHTGHSLKIPHHQYARQMYLTTPVGRN